MLWELPGGRNLTHVVEPYADATEQFSLLAANSLCLTGRAAPLAGPAVRVLPVDASTGLCFAREGGNTCMAVVAKGDLMMAVTVEAKSRDDAAAVVERVMPKAVAALDRA